MSKISVVIATKNEELNINIRNCLESVRWADEIVVIDDASFDKTVEICREYTQNIFVNDCKGVIHNNKNLGIKKATGNWILNLDDDEIVSPELKDEILSVINTPFPNIIGYYIPRKNYFLGKWIRGCGWYPDYIMRLFKKGAAYWPLDLHDVPKIKEENKVGYLRGPLIHYSYHDLNQYFEKFNRNTTRLAQEEYEKGTRITIINFFLFFLIKPIFWFLKKYFLYQGFRDGFRGFFISFSSALVIFLTYAKLWERQNYFRK